MTDNRTHLFELNTEPSSDPGCPCKQGEPCDRACPCSSSYRSGVCGRCTVRNRYTDKINPKAAWVVGHTEECVLVHSIVVIGEPLRCDCGHDSVRVDVTANYTYDVTAFAQGPWTLADIRDLFRLKGDVECALITCNIPGREVWVDRELMP